MLRFIFGFVLGFSTAAVIGGYLVLRAFDDRSL